MNEFTKAELEGRRKFEQFLQQMKITQYKFTEHPMDRIDCVYKSKHHYIVEIKVRYQDWETLYMELSKYNAMQQMKLDQGLYVNFIGDKCYIFNLKKIEQYFKDCYKQKKHPTKWALVNQTTAVYSRKVWKEVIDLPKSLAICLTLKDGQWVKG